MITCPSKDQLKQLLNRQVDDTEVVEIESHIQSCEACQKAFQEIKQKFDIIWGQTRSSNEPIANANPIGSASTIGTQNPNPTVEISENVSIPGYEISGLLGSGAMGVVYKARHIQLQREVAIKMILAGEHADQGKRTRFRTEAEAIARLQHSNIIQIHEIGEHQGLPYISLELCEGGTLRSKLDGTPWQPKDAASLVEKLGRAIQVAHQAKVIHRDLKPGNILFGVGGEAKITDFGLAKKLDGEESNSQTQTGAVVGTPSYMAPEQASSERKELSPATDTYALGAILYELLTGRPPFKAATLMDTLWQVLNKDPIPVRQLQPNVPRDLETICLKCLRKDPSKRYPSARDLAEDLQSFLDGQPIKARPVGKLERAAKWVKRNAALAASLAAVFVVLALGAGISTWQAIRATDAEWLAKAEAKRAKKNEDQAWKAEKKARDAKKIALDAEKIAKDAEGKARDAEAKAKDAEKDAKDSEKKARKAKKKAILEAKRANENKIRAEKAEKTTRRRLYSAKMNLGDVAWSRKYSGRLLELLEAQRPLPGQLDRRGFEWYYLWWLSHRGNKFTLRGHRDTVWAVAYSPDGRTLASSSSDGTIRLWDVETGKLQAILTSGSGGAYCLAYSPDGKTLCAGRSNSSVEIWDLATNQVRFTLRGHSRAVTSVVFSEDGNILATGEHYEIQIWDTSSWKELRSFKAKGVGSISLSPDGNTVAFCGFQNVRLGNLKTGKVRSLPGDHHWWIWTVAFSPDGKLVASGARDEATVMIWDVETGEKFRGLHGHTKGVHSVVFSQDGKQLASGSGDGTARVWDLATGEHQSYGHLGPVRSVAFSPDGKGLATAGEDYTVKLWDLNVKHQRLVLPRQKGLVWSVAFSPDNRYLATACNGEKTIRVWDLKSGKERLSLVGHKETNCAVAFSPDGKLLASGGHDRSAKIWDLSTGKEIATLTGHKGHIHALAFSPDGKKLASSGTTNEVMLWDTTSWKRIATHTINKQHSWALSFSPDSKNLGVGTNDGKLRIINVVTGRENNILHSGGFDANGSQVFFSPDGSKLAALSEEVVRIWDLSTGEEIRLIGGSQISAQPHCIAFSSDWKILAVGSSDGSVKLWDVERGEERATLRGHTDEVTTIAFSPDDRMLATGGWSGIVQIWSTASEQDVLAQSYVHDPREGLAWSLVEGGDKVWSNQPKSC